ncbi:unnamed protein product [Caenorhabditis bovis]|uniref:Lipocalin domain-containing protein n=1 Tax=Caenorhabditis bovis TaxID=2654633 RepID=A0A8S1E6R6_9PELO|nr:unnamed protein product [Caenorhabditis bovis]
MSNGSKVGVAPFAMELGPIGDKVDDVGGRRIRRAHNIRTAFVFRGRRFIPDCMLSIGLVAVLIAGVGAQLDAFALPSAQRYANKPTVPPEFSKYFELDGHARELVDSLLGPRPGGLFPEKTFEIGAPEAPTGGNQPTHVVSKLERTLESFFTAPESPQGQGLPPGFGSGFGLFNNNKALTSYGDIRRSPESKKTAAKEEDEVEGSGEKSSIKGIPKIFPKLPKAPINEPDPNIYKKPALTASKTDVDSIPTIQSAPTVPEGGFLPSEIRRAPSSVSEVSHSIDAKSDALETEEYGGLSDESSSSSGGLIGTIFNLLSLGAKKAKEGGKGAADGKPDKNAIGKAVSGLLGGENSPLPGKNILSNMLYKTLTSGSIDSNDTMPLTERKGNESIVLTPAQSAAISENLEMIQNLIIQPSSPLCTSKPEPVEFDLDSFMGQWYQVVYSPPVATGPCSMVAYKKLNDVGNGVGSIFEVFEYTTDGTPYGKPTISSGYSIIKSPGELIFRTTANQDDVTVHVLHVGPKNSNNQYEYAIMSTNCNFPLYVFARDATVYKQKYESIVTEYLEKKGLVNGFSRLLNIVSPVDNSMCVFPPSLFNIQG